MKPVIKSVSRVTLLESIGQCRREAYAEGIGTFILVFAGTGAVMVNKISDGAITHVGISFVFGAVVAALIYGTRTFEWRTL
jgi:aquaporin Z